MMGPEHSPAERGDGDAVEIRTVTEDRKQFLSLLLLADEQEGMVDRYLERGTMYVLEDGGAVRAECVVTDEGAGVLELKNLAVEPAFQGRGYGRRLIEFLAGPTPGASPFFRSGRGTARLRSPSMSGAALSATTG